jgi:hypothetical protein
MMRDAIMALVSISVQGTHTAFSSSRARIIHLAAKGEEEEEGFRLVELGDAPQVLADLRGEQLPLLGVEAVSCFLDLLA